jgi:DNA-binding NarL/FixJ family response regulator
MTITVFLADDHGIVRNGLRSFLSTQSDIEVVGEAGNGRDAVHRVEDLCPDVAVVDIAMPELNGIDATQQIRQVSPSTRIVILSMYSTTEHVFQALQAGAHGYLLKESAGTELVEAIRAVHAGHRYLTQKISDKVIDDYVRQCQVAGAKSPLASLSQREREVFHLTVNGKTNAEIADILSICHNTVNTYRSRLMQKLGISNLVGLVKFAIQHGLTSSE